MKAAASGTVNSGKARLWGSLSHLGSEGYRENNDYRRTSVSVNGKMDGTKLVSKCDVSFHGC